MQNTKQISHKRSKRKCAIHNLYRFYCIMNSRLANNTQAHHYCQCYSHFVSNKVLHVYRSNTFFSHSIIYNILGTYGINNIFRGPNNKTQT